MEIVETEHFYQIRTDDTRATDFIKGVMNELWGLMVQIRFVNTYDENLSITFSSISEAIEWLEKGFWVRITVTVLKIVGE